MSKMDENYLLLPADIGYPYGVEARAKSPGDEEEGFKFVELHGAWETREEAERFRAQLLREYDDYAYVKVVKNRNTKGIGMSKFKVTEAWFESMLDIKIMRELRTDPRYVHAENAEEQSEAEEAISNECEARLRERYEVL